jgi:hypothetical protein
MSTDDEIDAFLKDIRRACIPTAEEINKANRSMWEARFIWRDLLRLWEQGDTTEDDIVACLDAALRDFFPSEGR